MVIRIEQLKGSLVEVTEYTIEVDKNAKFREPHLGVTLLPRAAQVWGVQGFLERHVGGCIFKSNCIFWDIYMCVGDVTW